MFAIISSEKWKTEIDNDCDGAYRYKILRGNITYTCCGFVVTSAHTFMGDGDGDKCPKCGAEIIFSRKLNYKEILRQEYNGNNCVFSAGFVEGHPVDTMYIRLEKDDAEPTTILLRPDEMACIAWLATGVMWSKEMEKLP